MLRAPAGASSGRPPLGRADSCLILQCVRIVFSFATPFSVTLHSASVCGRMSVSRDAKVTHKLLVAGWFRCVSRGLDVRIRSQTVFLVPPASITCRVQSYANCGVFHDGIDDSIAVPSRFIDIIDGKLVPGELQPDFLEIFTRAKKSWLPFRSTDLDFLASGAALLIRCRRTVFRWRPSAGRRCLPVA